MALTKTVLPDRSKIDMRDEKQVKAWSKRLGISPTELAKIVQTVGNRVAAVQTELERMRHQPSQLKN